MDLKILMSSRQRRLGKRNCNPHSINANANSTSTTPGASALLVVSLLTFSAPVIQAAVPCDETDVFSSVCAEKLHPKSVCVDGFCNNPFQMGCLHTAKPEEYPFKRICSSHDAPEDIGVLCEPSPEVFDYTELRILAQDWDSTVFSTWVMQVVLSELVRVPISVETSNPENEMNFYNAENRFDYGSASYDYTSLSTANDFQGDCSKAPNEQSCAHVMPEAWNGQFANIKEAEDTALIEPAVAAGGVAKYSWFIPRYLAEQDHTLLSHFGLRGEQARRKLASTFLRPTTWGDYCTQVSPTNCTSTSPDANGNGTAIVATRPPNDETEAQQYFSQGLYTGHFRPTWENDCDNNPDCTGHITNVVCTWSTFVVAQSHYLDIHVKSSGPTVNGGYPFQRMLEIYRAANATKSPVLFYWFQPDPMLQEFVGTDAEFQQILMPFPTQDCVDSRVSAVDRCSANVDEQRGLEAGSCDSEPHSYQKLIASSLYDAAYVLETNDAKRSPAYDAVKNFRISDLQLNDMFRYWYGRNIDRWGYDPREAVCQWVVGNVDELKRYVPRSYPRTYETTDSTSPLKYAAMGIGYLACALVAVTGVGVYGMRKQRVIRNAQVEFVFLILLGLLLVSIGSVLVVAEPTDAKCMAVAWIIVLGYTMELIPLIVKVAAINAVIHASRKMQRIKLSKRSLFGSVFFILLLTSVFMLCWTIFDPWTRQEDLILTDGENEFGGSVVTASYYCGSDSPGWIYSSLAWQVLLLICASVLAFQSRNIISEFNESRRLVFMIYSHMVFVILRVISLLLQPALTEDLTGLQSLVYSLDIIFTLGIYFVPQFIAAHEQNKKGHGRRRSSLHVYTPDAPGGFKVWSSIKRESEASGIGLGHRSQSAPHKVLAKAIAAATNDMPNKRSKSVPSLNVPSEIDELQEPALGRPGVPVIDSYSMPDRMVSVDDRSYSVESGMGSDDDENADGMVILPSPHLMEESKSAEFNIPNPSKRGNKKKNLIHRIRLIPPRIKERSLEDEPSGDVERNGSLSSTQQSTAVFNISSADRTATSRTSQDDERVISDI